MSETPLAKRLGIKAGQRALVLNAPDGYRLEEGLPDGARVAREAEGQYDVVQVFVRSQSEANALTPTALAALKPDGWLWLTYPKQSAKTGTDISRDVGWDALRAAGWEGIAIVSVDETWSALRFRPSADVKRGRR